MKFFLILLLISLTSQTVRAENQNTLILRRVLSLLFGHADTNTREEIRDRLRTYSLYRNNFERDLSEPTSCHESLVLLKSSYTKLRSGKSEQLSFTNAQSEYDDTNPQTIGYCWGHASVARYFATFARFSPNTASPFNETTQPKEWLLDFEKRIDLILSGKTTLIPAFSDLYSFSAHPSLTKLLKMKVAKNWGKDAVNWRAFFYYLGLTKPKMSSSEITELLKELEIRTRSFQIPKIALVQLKKVTNTHMVMVKEVRHNSDGSVSLCINDSNEVPEKSVDCESKINLTRAGEMFYPFWKTPELRRIEIVPEEEIEVVNAVKELSRSCSTKRRY